MEEAADFAAVGVNAGEVRPFVQIAVRAGEGEVFFGGDAAVLSRDDVLEMEWQHAAFLRKPAVFAAATRALAGQLPERCGHLRGALAEGGTGLGAENGEERVCGDDGLEFAALIGRDDSLGVAVGQLMKARLVGGIALERSDGLE